MTYIKDSIITLVMQGIEQNIIVLFHTIRGLINDGGSF